MEWKYLPTNIPTLFNYPYGHEVQSWKQNFNSIVRLYYKLLRTVPGCDADDIIMTSSGVFTMSELAIQIIRSKSKLNE